MGNTQVSLEHLAQGRVSQEEKDQVAILLAEGLTRNGSIDEAIKILEGQKTVRGSVPAWISITRREAANDLSTLSQWLDRIDAQPNPMRKAAMLLGIAAAIGDAK